MKDDRAQPPISPSTDERALLRKKCAEAWHFADGEPLGDGELFPQVSPIFGSLVILVPPGSPPCPWRDPRARIGACTVHTELPANVALEGDPCAFRATSFWAGNDPQLLYLALFADQMAASPDLPRRVLWASVRNWEIYRLRLNGARVAEMTGSGGEGFLPGGEPMLRRSDASWAWPRWTVSEGNAAMMLVESDPAGSRLAGRLIMFSHPSEALFRAGALEAERLEVTPRMWPGLSERGPDGRRVLPQVMLTSGEKRPVSTRYYARLTRAWACTRRGWLRQRDTWRRRRAELWAFTVRELALDEMDSDQRFKVRMQLIITFKATLRPQRHRGIALASSAAALGALFMHFVLGVY